MIYLAMYKAKGNWVDKVIRLFTGKPYSHCEIAVRTEPNNAFCCYTSSPRDGGVRRKVMNLNPDSWDLIPLYGDVAENVEYIFQQDQGKKYDFLGAVGVVIGTPQNPNRYFCSEWCYKVIYGTHNGAKLSPNELAERVKKDNSKLN